MLVVMVAVVAEQPTVKFVASFSLKCRLMTRVYRPVLSIPYQLTVWTNWSSWAFVGVHSHAVYPVDEGAPHFIPSGPKICRRGNLLIIVPLLV